MPIVFHRHWMLPLTSFVTSIVSPRKLGYGSRPGTIPHYRIGSWIELSQRLIVWPRKRAIGSTMDDFGLGKVLIAVRAHANTCGNTPKPWLGSSLKSNATLASVLITVSPITTMASSIIAANSIPVRLQQTGRLGLF